MAERTPERGTPTTQNNESRELKKNAERISNERNRKLKFAGVFVAGALALLSEVSSSENDQTSSITDSTAQQHPDRHGVEDSIKEHQAKTKLAAAVAILSHLPEVKSITPEQTEQDIGLERLNTLLQSATFNREYIRNFHRQPGELYPMSEWLHGVPEETFDTAVDAITYDQIEDYTYISLGGNNGVDLVVSVGTDPTRNIPALIIESDSGEPIKYYSLRDVEYEGQNDKNGVEQIIGFNLEQEVIASVKRQYEQDTAGDFE